MAKSTCKIPIVAYSEADQVDDELIDIGYGIVLKRSFVLIFFLQKLQLCTLCCIVYLVYYARSKYICTEKDFYCDFVVVAINICLV